METLLLILCIVAAVLVSSFVSRFIPRISTPLVQIALGALMALLPLFPKMQLDPELFMVLFIAPLLYYEAHTIDKAELLRDIRFSLSLAIGLAALTMVMVGVILHAAWPMFPLAAAVALGAAVGPTDAVAVSSLGDSAHLTTRQHSILAGESLFNDATGVVGFQFAILAAVTGTFSPVQVASEFVISFLGGVAFGAVAGFLVNWVFETSRLLGWETTTTRILLELFLPFLIYMVGQNLLHVSGVLAVVTTGLLARFDHTGVGPNTSKTNIVSTSVWKVFSFSLNGSVFVILGMLLPAALGTSWRDQRVSNWQLVGTIATVCLTVIFLRFIWSTIVLRFSKDPQTGRREHMDAERWRTAAIMTFGGPKGTITLSLALTIPYEVASGAPFPMRSELIFVAAGVIIVTLVLANFALPILAPVGDQEVPAQQVEKSISVLRRTIKELSSRINGDNRLAIQHVIRQYNQRIAKLKSQIGEYNPKEFRKLQVQTMEWEQDYMRERLNRIEAEEDQVENALSLHEKAGAARRRPGQGREADAAEAHGTLAVADGAGETTNTVGASGPDMSDEYTATGGRSRIPTSDQADRTGPGDADMQEPEDTIDLDEMPTGQLPPGLAADRDADADVEHIRRNLAGAGDDSPSGIRQADACDDLRIRLEELNSQEEAARKILNNISNALLHLDRGGEIRWRIYTTGRRVHDLFRGLFHRLGHATPQISENKVFTAGRHLQMEMNHFLVEKLYAELGTGRFKTEDLLATIINRQMVESTAEGRPDYTGMPAVRDHVEEAKREGYTIELGEIQDMYESGEISRSMARELRRNVYVMQVDADSAL